MHDENQHGRRVDRRWAEGLEDGSIAVRSGRDIRKQEENARIDEMRQKWRPAYERIVAQFNSDPDLSRRASFALLPFDMAMTSHDQKIIMVAMDMMRKMYGHDERTVNVNEGRETLDQKMTRWAREASVAVDRLLGENDAGNATIEVKAEVVSSNASRLDELMPKEKGA